MTESSFFQKSGLVFMIASIKNEILTGLQCLEREIATIYVSTYIPRPCGIATYTKDLTNAINVLNPGKLAEIAVLDNPEDNYQYPWEVKFRIAKNDLASYLQAADYINKSSAQLVNIQHEFGVFGGEWGNYLIPFMEQIKKPLITTLHTVVEEPESEMLSITKKIGFYSDAVTVMSQACVERLRKIYEVDKRKIVVISHGVPDIEFASTGEWKKKLGLEGKTVIASINLIREDRGLDYVIEALPSVVNKHPEVVFLIIGVTHPEVFKIEGESYREKLKALVKKLNLSGHVRFDNRYISLEELINFLKASDFYVTTYRGKDQTASGTLAYALSAGKLCISTPYVYAKEVLADGRGVLVPFGQIEPIAKAINDYIENTHERERTMQRAYNYGRFMIWSNVASKHLNLFRLILNKRKNKSSFDPPSRKSEVF